MDNLAKRIVNTTQQCLQIIVDHATEEYIATEGVKIAARFKGFISAMRAINLYALSTIDIATIITNIFIVGKNLANPISIESNVSLLVKLRSRLLIDFVGEDREILIDTFAKANAIGSLIDNESDNSISRYVTEEQLRKEAERDIIIVVVWFFHLMSMSDMVSSVSIVEPKKSDE